MAGAVFICSIFFLYPEIWNFFSKLGQYEELVVGIVGSFLIGIIIQEIGGWIDRNITHVNEEMLSTFLMKNSDIIGNVEKKKRYRKYGREILESGGLTYNKEFTNDQCMYIYGFCCYYIEIRGKHNKLEKMRALYDMSRTLWVLFIILFFIQVGKLFFYPNVTIINGDIILLLINIFFIRVLAIRMRKSMINKIRMTMGMYEACVNMEKQK